METYSHSRTLWFFFFLVIAIFAFSGIAIAQTSPQPASEKSNDSDEQSSLDGLTEAILVNNLPTLRVLSRKKGGISEIKLLKRDSEYSLVFDVVKSSVKNPVGKLFVTKDRVIFEPMEKGQTSFNIEKTKIQKLSLKKTFDGFSSIKIDFDGNEAKIVIKFDRYQYLIDRRSQKAIHSFLYRAIEDFDSALAEFNQRAASIRPENDYEETEEAETTAEISSVYDRFKDVTFIRTSNMLVRGDNRPIRANTEYSFAGKKQVKPEKVMLYFYASAESSLFNEDELELNFLIDEKRLPAGTMKLVEEEKTTSSIKQAIVIALPFEVFAQIANAKKVEFQVGRLEYKLSNTHLEAFRKLLLYNLEGKDEN